MINNGGFPPLLEINKNIKKDKKSKKDRFYISNTYKNIVKINDIIDNIKKPMIEMNKEEIKIIDSL